MQTVYISRSTNGDILGAHSSKFRAVKYWTEQYGEDAILIRDFKFDKERRLTLVSRLETNQLLGSILAVDLDSLQPVRSQVLDPKLISKGPEAATITDSAKVTPRRRTEREIRRALIVAFLKLVYNLAMLAAIVYVYLLIYGVVKY